MARIGLMGCGVVAEYGHLPAIMKTDSLDLAAVYDPSPDRLAVGVQFGNAKGFVDERAFFESGLDAVVVCSPAWAHKKNVFAAAEHRIPVLCEKPLAMNDVDAESMIVAMERAGAPLYTAFVYRFSPVALQIKRWVDEGRAGDIRSLRLVYDWDLHGQWEQDETGLWVESPRWRGRMLEGGPLVDCGVHQIDLARWWLGDEVVRQSAAGAWVSNYEAPDHMYLHLDHSKGAHTMVEVSFTYGHTACERSPIFTYDLIGTGGMLHYNRHGWVLEARDGHEVVRLPGSSEKDFGGMYAAFALALETGEPGNMPSGRDGLKATTIARRATDAVIAART